MENPQRTKTPRNIYLDEKEGKPTRYNVAREDIRAALSISGFDKQFGQTMRAMGYEFSVNKTGRTLIKAQGWKYFIPLDSLGEEFSRENICLALMRNNHFHQYQPPIRFQTRRAHLRGKFSEVKKITGLQAQYFHLCYRMGIFHSYKPLSPEMRQEVRKMDRYMERLRLLVLRLSKDEMHHLNKSVKKTTFSREGYVRRLISGYEPQAAPPDEYYEIIRELRKMDNELRKYADTIPLSSLDSLAFFGSVTKRMTNACDRLQNLFLPRRKE